MSEPKFKKSILFQFGVWGLICVLPVLSQAQTHAEKVNESLKTDAHFTDLLDHFLNSRPIIKVSDNIKTEHSIMLPSPGKEHSSPLFCRLENKINEGNKIQCLFRLGSVSYVNYLEQKGDHQRLMLEQLQ